MSFSVGIVGLPNVGKSTLFKALTKKSVEIAPYPFSTIHPNFGVVAVPDERLKKISQIIKPEKITPTIIEFVDIAGLIKGSHKGEGLGNQFLAQIRNCDAILEVIRAFEDSNIENVSGAINPQKDIEIIKTELELKDLENRKVAETSSHLPPRPASRDSAKEDVLSKKPIVYLLNINSKTPYQKPEVEHLSINLKDEVDMTELSDSEKKELNLTSQLDRIITSCYNILNLITFYTVAGGKEVRARTLKKDSKVTEAGKTVHSDFKEKFIKAEIINWKSLIEIGGWKKAKELGKIEIVGRDYTVKDGDVIEFKI